MRKSLSRVWRGFNKFVEEVGNYIICMGLARGGLLLISRAIRSSLIPQSVLAPVPGSDVKLLVRPGTSDIFVFNSTFHDNEHDWAFVSPPQVILDAGAYTGLSACYFAMRYPRARVIALEPDAANFALLTQNVASFKNVQAINGALWSESGVLVVTDPGRGAWGLTVHESGGSGADRANVAAEHACGSTVRAFTVSDIMRECGVDKIDLLKLDIEGSEKEVLSNSGSWIKHVSAMSVELHDRFKPGCSRAFFNAVTDFPVELRRGEKVLVARDDPPIIPLQS